MHFRYLSNDIVSFPLNRCHVCNQ